MTTRRLPRLALAVVVLAGCESGGAAATARVPTTSSAVIAVAPTSIEATLAPLQTDSTRPEDSGQRATLDAARARWRASGTRVYAMRVRAACGCPMYGPWDIVVRDGVMASATPVDRESQLNVIEGFRTVDELFGQLDRAVREAGRVSAVYDTAMGYPAQVYIDWIANAIDDEMAWTITSLTPGASAPTGAVAGPGRPLHEPTRADLDQLAATQARWNTAGLTTYSFRIVYRSNGSGRDGHWDVRIDDDVNTTTAFDITKPPGLPAPPELVDVPALLAQMRAELLSVDALAVDYDPVLGFPLRASIDRNGRLPGLEVSWEIESFTAG